VGPQPADVPVREGVNIALYYGIGARYIAWVRDTALGALNELPVFVVGGTPHPCQAFKVIIDAFYRVRVDQPRGADEALTWR
jgi:hypothetical protein